MPKAVARRKISHPRLCTVTELHHSLIRLERASPWRKSQQCRISNLLEQHSIWKTDRNCNNNKCSRKTYMGARKFLEIHIQTILTLQARAKMESKTHIFCTLDRLECHRTANLLTKLSCNHRLRLSNNNLSPGKWICEMNRWMITQMNTNVVTIKWIQNQQCLLSKTSRHRQLPSKA